MEIFVGINLKEIWNYPDPAKNIQDFINRIKLKEESFEKVGLKIIWCHKGVDKFRHQFVCLKEDIRDLSSGAGYRVILSTTKIKQDAKKLEHSLRKLGFNGKLRPRLIIYKMPSATEGVEW